jgi:hypothetical protein
LIVQTFEVDAADYRCGEGGRAATALASQRAEGSLGALTGEVEFVTDIVELCQLELDYRVRVSLQLIGQFSTSGLDVARPK